MAEATFEPARRSRARRDIPVPGYPLDPVGGVGDRATKQPSGFWQVAAVIVQALLCILVVLAALSTVVG